MQISLCPERAELKKFINQDNAGLLAKEYAAILKTLTENYRLSFHNYFAEIYPHLRFEIGEEKVFWQYSEDEGVYEEVSVTTVRELVIKLLIDEGLRPSATEAFAKTVIARYRACFKERGSTYDDFDSQDDWFHCKNGWLNLHTLAFDVHSPERISRRVSAVVYNKDAPCPIYDALLDTKLNIPQDQVQVIDEFSGLLLTPDITKQKMLALIGKPGCGKSTLIELWMSILGDCATKQSLADLSGDSSRFMGSSFIDRTLCWFDEVEPNRAKMGDKLIGMVTADAINIERKGINGITKAENKLKFVLTANALPRSAEIGIYRRLILIELNNSFYESKDLDTKIKEKLEAEMSGVFNRMLRGLTALTEQGAFTFISGQEQTIEEYKMSSNTIAEFLEEFFETGDDDSSIETKTLLNSYKDFSGDKYAHSLTPQKFGILIGQSGLKKFENIKTKRGTGGKRMWKGLKLKSAYKVDASGKIVEDNF